MKEIFLLVGAFLVISVNANGRGSREGRSACMISRSIEVDEDVPHGKQASINPGSIFIPNSMDDDTSESQDEDDEDYEDDEQNDEDDDDDSDDLGHAGGYPPVPMQYAGGYGGYGPWAQPNRDTSVSVSSDMGQPSFYDSGDKEKYKYKRKSGGKNKKGGNINCIIITKKGHHKHHHGNRKKPAKLFGIFPMGGNRRSIARGLRALKN